MDANIIFAALIVEGKTAELLFRDNLQPYAPHHYFTEFTAHQEDIARKTRRDDPGTFILRLQRRMTFIEAKREFVETATSITPDPADIPYIALALQLGCPIWSNDRRLKGCGVPVFTTAELLQTQDRNQKPYK